jgi:hypothetical protein
MLVNQRNRGRPLADGATDALHGARPDISHRENARDVRLERRGNARLRIARGGFSRQDETIRIERYAAAAKPFRFGISANEQELSIVVALVIGSIELAQVLIRLTGSSGGAFDAIAVLDFGVLGYLIVGLFLLVWGSSVAIWRLGRLEQRHAVVGAVHVHPHR